MADVVRELPNLDEGERKLWAESWIAGVEVERKEVVAVLTVPPFSLGFLPAALVC
jgi:hypothetical protein